MTSTLCRFVRGFQLDSNQMSPIIATGAVFFFFGLDEVRAERRCATVTTGDRAVNYVTRTYDCANADGSGREEHEVLGGIWSIPANSSRTRYFNVPCTGGKHVIRVRANYLWKEEDCTDGLDRVRIPIGTPIGSVTTRLLCGGEPARGVCSDIFSCGLDDGDLTSVCFTPPDPDDCACSDPDPPQEGVDYVIGGEEFDLLPPDGPAVSEWGLAIITLLAMTLGTIMLARRREERVAETA